MKQNSSSITDSAYPLLPQHNLTTADAQRVALLVLNRTLRASELRRISDYYAPSCSCEMWDLAMESAIDQAVDTPNRAVESNDPRSQ